MRKMTCWTLSAVLVICLLIAPAALAAPNDATRSSLGWFEGVTSWIAEMVGLGTDLRVPANYGTPATLPESTGNGTGAPNASGSGSGDVGGSTDPNG